MSRHAPRTSAPNSIVESGRAAWRRSGQVDGGREPRPDRERPRPAGGQPALRGDVRREPPGEDREDRAREHRDHLRGAHRGLEADRRGPGEEGDRDRGEQRGERQPDLERRPRELERRRAVAPERVRDEPAALDEVARDADVVRRVLGLGEADDRGRDDAHGERDDEDPEHGQPRLAAGERPAVGHGAGHRHGAGTRDTRRRRRSRGSARPPNRAAARRRGSARPRARCRRPRGSAT